MRLAVIALSLAAATAPAPAGDDGWTDLMKPEMWQKFDGRWVAADGVTLDPKNPKKLLPVPEDGAESGKVWVNGPGRVANLLTKADYGDCEISLEFAIAKGSNAGVKFHGLYEIQILDSYQKAKKLTGNDLGGVYPRAKNGPPYGYLDDGVPPRVNAAKPPGEWNTLTATWRAPRFDESGKKVADGVMELVTINGQVVQENTPCAQSDRARTGSRRTRQKGRS